MSFPSVCPVPWADLLAGAATDVVRVALNQWFFLGPREAEWSAILRDPQIRHGASEQRPLGGILKKLQTHAIRTAILPHLPAHLRSAWMQPARDAISQRQLSRFAAEHGHWVVRWACVPNVLIATNDDPHALRSVYISTTLYFSLDVSPPPTPCLTLSRP